MSAIEKNHGIQPPQTRRGDLAIAARALVLADLGLVHRQNMDWLSRRFGFKQQLSDTAAASDRAALGLDDSPYNHLPTWKRWITLLRQATVAGDDEARQRIRTALGFRLLGKRPGPVALAPILALDSNEVDEETYAAWVAHYDTLSAADLIIMQAGVATGTLPPLLVVVRFDHGAHDRAGAVAAALQAQAYPGWRALFVLPPGAAVLGLDRRIAVVASTDLSARLETAADFTILLDPAVVLRPHTLFAFAEAARSHPDHLLIYADEDRLDADGVRHAPVFKPSFSPELNRRMAYLGACVGVAPALLARLPAPGASIADWAAEHAERLDRATVGHVAQVLFHVRDPAAEAPRRPAVPPHLTQPSVAIVIPTRNHAALLGACVESIRSLTAYPPEKIRFILIDNGSDEPAALDLLDRLGREAGITVLRDPSPFNYARLNNVAAAAATEDVLVFLNNDTEVTEPDWLAFLAGWAAQPEIGVVGPKLLYPDRTIQHGGVVLGIGGVAGHSFVGLAGDDPGYLGLAGVTREAAALTGACIAIRRSVFEAIGGFDEQLQIAFNDTALCCEALHRGLRNLYVGEVSVLHHESKSRGFDDTPEKLARFRQECVRVRRRFKDLFDQDPYYSPNLGFERQYQPAIPRVPRIWHHYRRSLDPNPRILMLSDVHAVGHGVPVVIKQHAEYLAAQGWTVFVGGPMRAANEIDYAGCLRVYLDGPLEAQSFAYEAGIDCVVAHTMPYFSMFRTMSDAPRRVIFDHGEPPPSWFPDRKDRENIDAEKQFCYRLSELVLTNTATVKEEIDYDRAEVAGLGNSHLASWTEARAAGRDAVRRRLGLDGKVVVLNVCRFHRAERRYKGVGDYVALKQRIAAEQPARAERLVFVLCGKGSDTDRAEMEEEGLTVFANVSDDALIDLYAAADLYANFSRWEGFNLGIAQALAMGLEVVASDLPAHRAFPIETADDLDERARLLLAAIARTEAGRDRRAVSMPWEPLLAWLQDRLLTLCA